MCAYILTKNSFKNQELHPLHLEDLKHSWDALERELNVVLEAIKAFIKKPEDLDKFGDSIHKRVELERLILFLEEEFSVYPASDCISPNWEEIGIREREIKQKQNLTLELEFIKLPKRKTTKKQKSSLNINKVLDKAGVVVKRGFILCPFHNERNPSLRIYPQTNTFYCFGCGKWGTAKDLADALGVKL